MDREIRGSPTAAETMMDWLLPQLDCGKHIGWTWR
jgi:hypothetical protein